jgi:hypothetical protein
MKSRRAISFPFKNVDDYISSKIESGTDLVVEGCIHFNDSLAHQFRTLGYEKAYVGIDNYPVDKALRVDEFINADCLDKRIIESVVSKYKSKKPLFVTQFYMALMTMFAEDGIQKVLDLPIEDQMHYHPLLVGEIDVKTIESLISGRMPNQPRYFSSFFSSEDELILLGKFLEAAKNDNRACYWPTEDLLVLEPTNSKNSKKSEMVI